MKKFLFLNIFIVILSISNVSAQKQRIEYLANFDKKPVHFGFYFGVNNNSYKVSYFDQTGSDRSIYPTPTEDLFVNIDNGKGFNIGLVIDFLLHPNLNLRFEPGLMSTGSTILTFENANIANPLTYSGTQETRRTINGTYVHIPALFKFSTDRYNNIRPYLIGGASINYNFSSNENNGKDNYEEEFRMKSMVYMYEVGIGMDFYLDYFKFSPSIRGVFAINNELVRDNVHDHDPNGKAYSSPWTGPIDYFGTRGIFLNLCFE